MERSKGKVACGFAFQLLLYALYIGTGVGVVALNSLSAAEGGPSKLCLINIKVYAWCVASPCATHTCVGRAVGRADHAQSPTHHPPTHIHSIGVLAAFRSLVKLCISFHKVRARVCMYKQVDTC